MPLALTTATKILTAHTIQDTATANVTGDIQYHVRTPLLAYSTDMTYLEMHGTRRIQTN